MQTTQCVTERANTFDMCSVMIGRKIDESLI